MTDPEAAKALARIADALDVIGERLGELVEIGHAPTDIAHELRLLRAGGSEELAEVLRQRDDAQALLEQAVARIRELGAST